VGILEVVMLSWGLTLLLVVAALIALVVLWRAAFG
jgi:hypothetical protein